MTVGFEMPTATESRLDRRLQLNQLLAIVGRCPDAKILTQHRIGFPKMRKRSFTVKHKQQTDFLPLAINLFVGDQFLICLLYTSDAADDMQCVDLGGCRII